MDKIMLTRECDVCQGDISCAKYPIICNYQQGHSGKYCGYPDGCEDQRFCDCCTGGTTTRPMAPAEQREHHRHIIARANQSVTELHGFVDNTLFFRNAVQEAHTFTDKHGVEWQVGLTH